MTPEIKAALAEVAPNIAFETERTIDHEFEWDGDGQDPRDYDVPMDAYDVSFSASCIVYGEAYTGTDYLGGCYMTDDEEIGDCGGYLIQKLEAALDELESCLTTTEHTRNINVEIEAARQLLKAESRRTYVRQRPEFQLWNSTTDEGDHEWAHVCQSCAEQHKLETSDSCCGGNVCCIGDCQNETSLVHYLWDTRN